MANHLSMATIDFVLTLHQRGWSHRRIARELNIDRETVGRHLQAQGVSAKPANAPIGSDAPKEAPPGADASVPPRSGRGSDCAPWRAIILGKLEQGLSAQRIFQDL